MKQFKIFTFSLLFPSLLFPLFCFCDLYLDLFFNSNTPRNMSLYWSSFSLRYFNSLFTLFLASSSLVITFSSNNLEYSSPRIKLPVFEWKRVLSWALMRLSNSSRVATYTRSGRKATHFLLQTAEDQSWSRLLIIPVKSFSVGRDVTFLGHTRGRVTVFL